MLLMPVLAIAQALSSCSLIDEPEAGGDVSVNASLAFTVSSAAGATTRMADAVVQEQGNGRSYRGLGDVYMIPFIISGDQVTASDKPQWLFDNVSQAQNPSLYEKTGNYGGFYLYQAYSLMRGINAFLVYGKAKEISNVSGGKDYYGSLIIPPFDVNLDLATLRFKPDSIYTGTTTPAEATLLAGYLNDIAKTTGWSDTSDSFLFFTGLKNEENNMLAGSCANVMAHLNALYSMVKSESELRTAIRDQIINSASSWNISLKSTGSDDSWELTDLKVNNKSYPASLGLPDGAAALRWGKIPENPDVYGFAPRVEWTAQDNINNIGRFAYPPELFYRANSRINTSNNTVGVTVYNENTNWGAVCDEYQYQPGTVTIYTKSVAIREPLQYAVGRLKINLKAETTTGALKDSKGNDVPLTYEENNTTKSSFPLTGVIVCNQHPVDFNFKPVLENGAASHDEDRFIYDSQVKNGENYYCLSTTEQSIPSTLVLQTYDTGEGSDKRGAEEVNIVLEFRNDSRQAFPGKSCVIYPGTKFYLVGKANPLKASSAGATPEAVGRVFTQDHMTIINTKVESLANAYDVLPDLIGGRLELGIELVSSWVQAETTNVILK